ncbi:MAG: beta-glucosidase, partial [Hyphomicrobiales bacterium]|nr:beta-glucosidase [Hyphomicrobiales bacterium]
MDAARIERLLDDMTLEERVSLLAGADFWTTVAVPRLGVPAIKVTDGPNGARGGGALLHGVSAACFPACVGLGASFDPALVREVGVALAAEAKSKGAQALLAPNVNIHRSATNGRNFECWSEDPKLTATLAVAYVEGLQSAGVAATVKHFAGNESEFERYTLSSDVPARALREVYLVPFEAAVKEARALAVMTAYNALDGVQCSENGFLISTVLRGQWGFGGLVMSDWFGSHTTAATVNAGLDLEMPGPTRDRGHKLVEAVAAGEVSAATVRDRARAVLRFVDALGAFERTPDFAEHADDRPATRALIRRAGAAGTVLLRNEGGLLPL